MDKVSEHLRDIGKLARCLARRWWEKTLVELGELALRDGCETELGLDSLVDC